MSFESIAIIGLGLIGGSIARAIRRLPGAPRVVGIDTDAVALRWALENGVVDDASLADGLGAQAWLQAGGVDLVVIATPARFAGEWFDRLASGGFDGVVTDVASTKRDVLDQAAKLNEGAAEFIGGHPMAGSERSGVSASRPDLFDGAYWILTPSAHTDLDAYQQLHEFVTSLGARVISIEAEEHDRAVAAISHVPHVAAAGLVALAAARAQAGEDALRLAAGGFKDMTRIAAGSPDLWTGICLDNADALTSGIDELCRHLETFASAVRRGDRTAVRDWLAVAADVRSSLPAQWVPKTAALSELAVPVTDRPGMVSEVTTAVSRAGCNIEDVSIDHLSEDAAVLRLVLTDEGDSDALLADLSERGYEPRLEPLAKEG